MLIDFGFLNGSTEENNDISCTTESTIKNCWHLHVYWISIRWARNSFVLNAELIFISDINCSITFINCDFHFEYRFIIVKHIRNLKINVVQIIPEKRVLIFRIDVSLTCRSTVRWIQTPTQVFIGISDERKQPE